MIIHIAIVFVMIKRHLVWVYNLLGQKYCRMCTDSFYIYTRSLQFCRLPAESLPCATIRVRHVALGFIVGYQSHRSISVIEPANSQDQFGLRGRKGKSAPPVRFHHPMRLTGWKARAFIPAPHRLF